MFIFRIKKAWLQLVDLVHTYIFTVPFNYVYEWYLLAYSFKSVLYLIKALVCFMK